MLYADTFVYKGIGVLIGGGSGSGKTSVAHQLVRYRPGSFMIRKDSPTVYKSSDEKIYAVHASGTRYRFRCDFGELLKTRPRVHQLHALLFLGHRENGSTICPGYLKEAMKWMCIFQSGDPPAKRKREQAYQEILGSLPVYRVFRYPTLEERVEAIKTVLDKIRRE